MIEAEGQPGAAASIVENMRGDFRVTPAVASTTQMDFVHLVICRGGVVLLGEGNPARVRGLIAQERKRLTKVIGSAELRDFMIGNDEGEIPIRKLRMTLMKLPRTLGPKDVNALDKRLKALSARPQLPKGAIPKNMRPPNMRDPASPLVTTARSATPRCPAGARRAGIAASAWTNATTWDASRRMQTCNHRRRGYPWTQHSVTRQGRGLELVDGSGRPLCDAAILGRHTARLRCNDRTAAALATCRAERRPRDQSISLC